MSEFHQEGFITTIHGFYDLFDPDEYLTRLERKLERFSKHMCISLLLPSLYQEIHVPGVLDNIIDQINEVNYLCSVVVALGGAREENQFREAKQRFYDLKKGPGQPKKAPRSLPGTGLSILCLIFTRIF